MKFLKIMAVILAVCMLSCSFIACNNGGSEKETEGETAAKVKVTVTLVIKDADGKEQAREAVTYEGTNPSLGNIIELYCVANDIDETKCFNEQGLLAAIGEISGSGWKAYYEDEGQSKAFDSIKDHVVADGKTVVVTLK